MRRNVEQRKAIVAKTGRTCAKLAELSAYFD
jgi:hypothetical protein